MLYIYVTGGCLFCWYFKTNEITSTIFWHYRNTETFILKQKNVATMKSNVALCVFWFKFSVYFLVFTKAEKLILVKILSPNAALLYQNQLNFSWLHFTIERPSVRNINIQMLTYYIGQRFSLNKI